MVYHAIEDGQQEGDPELPQGQLDQVRGELPIMDYDAVEDGQQERDPALPQAEIEQAVGDQIEIEVAQHPYAGSNPEGRYEGDQIGLFAQIVIDHGLEPHRKILVRQYVRFIAFFIFMFFHSFVFLSTGR